MRLVLRLILAGMFCAVAAAALAQSAGPKIISVPPQADRKFKRAEVIPLPRPRPPEAGPGNSVAEAVEDKPAEKEEATLPPEPPPPSACFLALMGTGAAVFEPLPAIAMPKGCEAPDVIKLDAVMLADKRKVTFNPPATLRCSLATELVNWIRDDLVAAAAPIGTLTAIENGSFECRGRNRVVGAKLSEHGKANAMDIGALLFSNKRRVNLTDWNVPRDFREKIRENVCARFMTILGPGSDGYHEEHVHVDLAERRNNYRICQWNVLDVPLPLPRPPDADVAWAEAEKQAAEDAAAAQAAKAGDKKP